MTRFTRLASMSGVGALLACGAPAMAAITPPSLTTFGSANEGYGGFTAQVSTLLPEKTPAPAWTLDANAARMTNAATNDSGQVNSSLLNEVTLTRTAGSAYTITGVIDWVSTYAADNNRAGILLFATSGDLAGADTGLSLQLNLGIGTFRVLTAGVNGGTTLVTATYNGLNGASAVGTVFTFVADVTFVGTNIDVDFTLIDQNSFAQTISTTVAAASYTGEFFGFATRGRVRGTTPGVNDVPFIYDAKSFQVAAVPEPASAALLGLGALAALRRRRAV